jgi:hypothetical protein
VLLLVVELRHALQLGKATQVLEHTAPLLYTMYALLEQLLAEDVMYPAPAALDLILEVHQVLTVHIVFQTQLVLKELFLEVDATDHLLQAVPARILEVLLEHRVRTLVAIPALKAAH